MGNVGRISEQPGDNTRGRNRVGLGPQWAQVAIRHVERGDSAVRAANKAVRGTIGKRASYAHSRLVDPIGKTERRAQRVERGDQAAPVAQVAEHVAGCVEIKAADLAVRV